MGKITPYAMRKHVFGESSRASSPQGQGLGQGLGLVQGVEPGQGQGQGEGVGEEQVSASVPELEEDQGPGQQGLAPTSASALGPGLGQRRGPPPVLSSLFKSSGKLVSGRERGGLRATDKCIDG